jgi:ribosomal subunit interface protein
MASMITSPTLPMNVQVSGRRIDLGEALRSRIASELVAAIGKYFDRGGSAEVVVGRDGHAFCVDMVVILASGQQLVARGLGGDAHSAFDTALTKIETRIRRYKRRLVNHHHNGAARTPSEITPLVVLRAPEDDDDFDEDWSGAVAAADGAPEAMIIAETEATVKTLTVSMAVMELDLTGAPVQLFRNAAHGGLSVVYRRPDGNIGWIDPERTRSSALS